MCVFVRVRAMDGSRGGRQAWARSAAAVLGNGIWAEPPTPKILSHFQTSSKGNHGGMSLNVLIFAVAHAYGPS